MCSQCSLLGLGTEILAVKMSKATENREGACGLCFPQAQAPPWGQLQTCVACWTAQEGGAARGQGSL